MPHASRGITADGFYLHLKRIIAIPLQISAVRQGPKSSAMWDAYSFFKTPSSRSSSVATRMMNTAFCSACKLAERRQLIFYSPMMKGEGQGRGCYRREPGRRKKKEWARRYIYGIQVSEVSIVLKYLPKPNFSKGMSQELEAFFRAALLPGLWPCAGAAAA